MKTISLIFTSPVLFSLLHMDSLYVSGKYKHNFMVCSLTKPRVMYNTFKVTLLTLSVRLFSMSNYVSRTISIFAHRENELNVCI